MVRPKTSTKIQSDALVSIFPMASWHDGSVCSRLDLYESEGLATCLSCGLYRDQPYVYKPIKQRSEMRLLKIQPGEADAPIRGELVIVSTNSHQDYDAVSYTWADQSGDATRRFRAFIESGYVSITRSCQEVLQRIRSRSYPKCIWIDSLCVDQDNLEERGHQVQLMPHIYTRANKTYVYVGPTTSIDESMLEALATGRLEHDWSADEEPFCFILNNFLRRPYFFRVWMIQEIALSPNPAILCGEKEFPWSVLQSDTALKSLPHHLTIGSEERLVSPLLLLGKRRLRYSTELPDLLRLGRHCQSTDPRDRVFALLGLVVDAEAESLVADYGRSTPEIFTWIARYLANTGTAADLLGNVNICEDSAGSDRLNQLQLPSWVPDWTNAGTTYLGRFPETRAYLESLPFQLDEHDMRTLVLSGFDVRDVDEQCLKDFGVAMFVRPHKQLPRFSLFQVEKDGLWRLYPPYLMILAPVMANEDGNQEVPGWKDLDDIGTYAAHERRSYCTFRFLGLLHLTYGSPALISFMSSDRFPYLNFVSIKLV